MQFHSEIGPLIRKGRFGLRYMIKNLHQERQMINPPTLKLSDDSEVGYRLKATMEVRLPIGEVFDFFSDAANLEAITPPWLNFQILTPMPFSIEKGSLLDYKLRLHYIPIKWRTEICVWQRPHRFVDQQLKGPYKKWYHEHTFEDIGNGITSVVDDVHYIPRGGAFLHRTMVRPDLEKIFRYRQEKLTEIFSKKSQTKYTRQESNLQPSVP